MSLTPGDPEETVAVTHWMLRNGGTCYLRLGRGNEPRIHTEPLDGWRFPEALRVADGTDTALLSAGGILTQTVAAREILREKGISAAVVSFPCLKPLDTGTLKELLGSFRRIVTVEEHTVNGGFGGAVCEVAAGTGNGCRILRIGLEDCFATVVGDQQYLRQVYGMDGASIAERAEAFLKE